MIATITIPRLVALSLLVSVSIADADEAISTQKRELLKELLVVTDVAKSRDRYLEAYYEELRATAIPQMIDAALKQQLDAAKLEDVADETMEEVIGKYAGDIVEKIKKTVTEKTDIGKEIGDSAMKLYGDELSEQELKSIIEFYKSSAGKKIASLMPKMSAEVLKITDDAVNKVVMDVYMKEIKADMPNIKKEIFDADGDD